jgi:hypothetical protein
VLKNTVDMNVGGAREKRWREIALQLANLLAESHQNIFLLLADLDKMDLPADVHAVKGEVRKDLQRVQSAFLKDFADIDRAGGS